MQLRGTQDAGALGSTPNTAWDGKAKGSSREMVRDPRASNRCQYLKATNKQKQKQKTAHKAAVLAQASWRCRSYSKTEAEAMEEGCSLSQK